jgi:predicted GNAT family acetyltransferase
VTDSPEPTVTRNDAENRYEIDIDGTVAELVFRRDGDRLELLHTEVPDAFEGRGFGSRLVKAALDDATRDHLTVVPSCPFVQSWLERHPDEAAKVDLAA